VGAARNRGQAISTEDAQLAAIALANGITVATRNTKDFENIDGLTLANPWQSSTPH
jgi:toxin FitB